MEERYSPWKAAYPLKMPEKFELEAYLSLSAEELFNLLNSTSTTQVFRALAALSLRNLGDDIFRSPENQELLRHVAAHGVTFKNRKLAYNLYCQLYPDQLEQIALGESKQIGYIYFLQEKKYGSIKIGRSLNLDLRLSSFVTDLPYRVELVGYIRSINYETIELTFHKHFRHKRLGGEWFELSAEEITDLKHHKFPKEIEELIIRD
ncbi:GIY-YIG nuclease family protein [Pedobacter nyackensis]|uniref:T5orf172 domain-containing protein n=1 Tax=Pedobacter nyackensis TaxID=475255 RepID=A0A1W2A1L9_9SPHI|nr:GIY-YIG nuclease family protein [Pedobacter nyackensis]SMC54587.1 T5orf172 domain-containing protein [Pedobacter nyackensis]